MATNTTNYNLIKPTDNEFAEISVINANMDIIDTGMKTLDNNKEALVKNATEKTTLADADALPLIDSADSSKTKKLSFVNLKILLKTIFATTEDISALNTSLSGKEGLIKNASAKATLVDGDTLPLTDSADSSKTKKISFLNLKTLLSSLFLPLTGGVLNGDLYMANAKKIITGTPTSRYGQIMHDGTTYAMTDYIDASNYSMLWHSASLALADRLRLYNVAGGVGTVYRLYGEHNPPPSNVVTGSYTGDGTAVRTISLGVTPKFVVILPYATSVYGYLLNLICYKIGDKSYVNQSTDQNYNNIYPIIAGGFRIGADDKANSVYNTNRSELSYNYVAFV